jgi:hypothetical protein
VQLIILPTTREQLKIELATAQQALVQAEAELAQEQAAVNAFRMHCRLKLGILIETLLTLREEKQSYLTRLQLWRQEHATTDLFDDHDPLLQTEKPLEETDDLLLPTDTPYDRAAEKRLYRELARRFHPDLAASAAERAYATSMMTAVNHAYTAHNLQALYDLAGELDPEELAELAGIETLEIRKLRENLLKCKQLQRKAVRQLQSLRQENTARLWRKAQELEEGGDNWWGVVRRELERVITRLQSEVEALKKEVEKVGVSSK